MKSVNIFKPNLAIIVLIIIFAFFLRLHQVYKYDLWFDEQATDVFSFQNLVSLADLSDTSVRTVMLDQIKNDAHSFLYYFIVFFYSIFFGGGEGLRILSVFFSVISVWLFYRLARQFFDRPASILAMGIMALNPFHIWYAQEARVYAIACFFSLLMSYVFIKAIKTDKNFYWVSFSLVSVVAICLDYFAVLLLIISASVLLFKDYRRHAEKWYISFCATVSILLLFQYFLLNQSSFVKSAFWVPSPTILTLLFTMDIFNLGYSASALQYQIGAGVFILLLVYGIRSFFRSNKADATVLFLFLFFPIAATFLFSKISTPVYIHRQLIIVSPFFYLFVVKGIESIRRNYFKISVIICVLVLMMGALANYYRGYMYPMESRGMYFLGALPKRNYHDLTDYMKQAFREGDVIATPEILSYQMAFLYILDRYRQSGKDFSERFCFLGYPILLEPYCAQFLRLMEPLGTLPFEEWEKLHIFSFFKGENIAMDQLELNGKDTPRIWLISSKWEVGEPFTANTVSVRNYMNKNFTKISSKEHNGIYIDLFVPQASHSSAKNNN